MNGLLVRVAVDASDRGGGWNGPVESGTRKFAYVPIPEPPEQAVRHGSETLYSGFAPAVEEFGVALPPSLTSRPAHLDPDFRYLTYGDRRTRGEQIRKTRPGDLLVFYASLRDVTTKRLVYAVIGLYVVDQCVLAGEVRPGDLDRNAHTRRVPIDESDVIVRGRQGESGRLGRCAPFGEWRNGAYRVRRDLLDAWGGLGVRDGYVQRSVRLPQLCDAPRFLEWLADQGAELIRENNPPLTEDL